MINPGLNPTATPGPGPLVPGMVQPPPADVSHLTGEPVENEDGSVDFVEPDEAEAPLSSVPHDANLAEAMEDDELNRVAEEVLEGIEADLESNRGYYDILDAGLKFINCKPGERMDKPFANAAGCIHPVMLEAGVRFQASARGEMLPAAGPVRTQIFGDETPDIEAKANRKRDWLNYYLTTKDEDYVPDFDQMLLLAGFYGSMFRKVYRDPERKGMPVSRSLSPKDLLVSYHATSLHGSERVTHIEPHVSRSTVKRLQLKAWYRDVDLSLPEEGETAEGERTDAETEGRTASGRPEDTAYKLYHCHCLLNLKGLEHRLQNAEDPEDEGEETGLPLPYIVTVEPESRQVLRISRNWADDDADFAPREYYVHYQYMPGFGFYGWGLIHLLGADADALTMMRRQAINTRTLNSFPGGVKTRGVKSEKMNLLAGPGEYVDVETGGLPIRDAIMPYPFNDLSPAHMQVMEEILQSAQRLGSIGDMAVGEGREDALPGTVIALIEKAVKLEAAAIKRLHTAQRKELRLLADLFAADRNAVYPYIVGGKKGQAVAADFDDNEDIAPVSDPNIPTQTQRLAQAQAVMQLANSSGGIVDRREATEDFLRTMGKTDQDIQRLMPPPQQGQPSDPVTEFAMVMKGMPLAIGPQQDHKAHFLTHLPQIQTPGLDKTPAYQALLAHAMEHVAAFFAAEASRMTGLPIVPGQPIPPQLEAKVTQAVAQVADQLGISLSQLAPATSADPLGMAKIQLEREKLQQNAQKMVLDAHEQDRKAAQDYADRQSDMTKLVATLANDKQQRDTEMAVNREETIRSVLTLRAAEVGANADVSTERMDQEASIAEALIGHADTKVRAKADVQVAAHDKNAAHGESRASVQVAAHEATAAKAAAEGERHKATAARFKPKPKGK